MLYFIPAWYKQGQWCENEQNWHVRRMHTEFDDTVKQIQLFHRSKAYPYQILLLSFTPNFRHFLHRQGVFHAPYWSCFDAIQEIRRKKPVVLSFHNIKWPEGIHFLYTQYVVVALLKGQKYAQIEFGEDGNPIQIDLYENGKVVRKNLYDDRGFVSSTIIYEEEKPVRQDYLMENGKWKLRCFQEDGHVEVNPSYPEYLVLYQKTEQTRKFSKLSYGNMEQVISEVLKSYLSLTEERDIFCTAMHERHVGLLQEALEGRRMMLSFFGNRYPLERYPKTCGIVRRAGYVIADSRENQMRIEERLRKEIKHITSITPYDSRVDFGISQQLNVQKIMVPIDEIGDEAFKELIQTLGNYLLQNEDARIHLFTRKADWDWKMRLLEKTRRCLKEVGLEEGWTMEDSAQDVSENQLEDLRAVPVKFFVEQCVDELEVSKCMREQRLVVDLRDVPELYLQIMAISVGIPQIVRKATEFVEDGRNGILLAEIRKLPEALDYYLNGLSNWNEAMVSSYEIGKNYTTDKLLEEWKRVIESMGAEDEWSKESGSGN